MNRLPFVKTSFLLFLIFTSNSLAGTVVLKKAGGAVFSWGDKIVAFKDLWDWLEGSDYQEDCGILYGDWWDTSTADYYFYLPPKTTASGSISSIVVKLYGKGGITHIRIGENQDSSDYAKYVGDEEKEYTIASFTGTSAQNILTETEDGLGTRLKIRVEIINFAEQFDLKYIQVEYIYSGVDDFVLNNFQEVLDFYRGMISFDEQIIDTKWQAEYSKEPLGKAIVACLSSAMGLCRSGYGINTYDTLKGGFQFLKSLKGALANIVNAVDRLEFFDGLLSGEPPYLGPQSSYSFPDGTMQLTQLKDACNGGKESLKSLAQAWLSGFDGWDNQQELNTLVSYSNNAANLLWKLLDKCEDAVGRNEDDDPLYRLYNIYRTNMNSTDNGSKYRAAAAEELIYSLEPLIVYEFNVEKSPEVQSSHLLDMFFQIQRQVPYIRINISPDDQSLIVKVDGNNYSRNSEFQWLLGSTHTLETTSPQAGTSGEQYVFAKWLRNGQEYSSSNRIQVNATDDIYTAVFTGSHSRYRYGGSEMCQSIGSDSSHSAINPTRTFDSSDPDHMCIRILLLDAYKNGVLDPPLEVKCEFYRPNGQFYSDGTWTVTPPSPGNYYSLRPLFVEEGEFREENFHFFYYPGRWKYMVYVDEGIGFKLVEQNSFDIVSSSTPLVFKRFAYLNTVSCKSIENENPWNAIEPSIIFSSDDPDHICFRTELSDVYLNHEYSPKLDLRYEFYRPDGSYYNMCHWNINPSETGDMWTWYICYARYSDIAYLVNHFFSYPGRWTYRILMDQGSGHEFIEQKYFDIISTPQTISGYIRDSNGNSLSGVMVSANKGGGTTQTDSAGYYGLKVSYGWSGSVVPLKLAFDYSPSQRDYVSVKSGISEQNYIGSHKTLAIAGYIRDASGTPASGIFVNPTNGAGTVQTNSSGYYSITVPYGWSGKVTPSVGKYIFTPLEREYTSVSSNMGNQNYLAAQQMILISGYIHDSQGTGIANVALSFSNNDGNITTDTNGYYNTTVPYGWVGQVIPTRSGYRFTPSIYDYSLPVTSSLPNQNILAIPLYGSGIGTSDSPYQIWSAEQMNSIGTNPVDWDKCFRLMCDIDMSGYTGTQYNRIGGFSGKFDGNGNIIKNVIIDNSSDNDIGIFGHLGSNGSITNLGVEKINIKGCRNVGGLVGWNSGTITSSYVTGSVSGSDGCVGGLVGGNSGTITSCYVSGSVSGFWDVGGLVGDNPGTITSCYATGSVSGSGAFVGGLVGENSGTITSCYATSEINGGGDVGGLVGDNHGTIIGSFWDMETSGQIDSSGGKGLTSVQMKTMVFFQNAGWSLHDWVIDEGQDYPRLTWQNTSGFPIVPDASLPLTGYGTPENPYQIQTPEDYALLSWHISVLDKHFVLMSDLDLSGVLLYPIGDSGLFTGTFNGNGHVIRNAAIDQPSCNYIGLFGRLGSGGSITNLGVEKINIKGCRNVGSLVGENSGTVTSCYATGSVSGSGAIVGGLVGGNSGTITSCYTTGSVSGSNLDVGGLVGDNSGTITFSYATGSVSDSGVSVGGLVGENSGTIISCYAKGEVNAAIWVGGLVGTNGGTITSCYSTGSVTGYYNQVGGLVGGNSGTITSCYVSGSVSGCRYVGGLVGWNSSTITSSYATGSVSGSGAFVGGLVGENFGTIISCYVSSSVSGGWDVGGLVGENSGTIIGSLWDMETSGLTTSDDGTGKTTLEMKTRSTFENAGWFFASTWSICEGTNYPRLQWQIPSSDQICPDGSGLEDLLNLTTHWFVSDPSEVGTSDLNHDGKVDLSDFTILSREWMAEHWLGGVGPLANRPPQFEPIGNQTVVAGLLLDITLKATDPDGDTVRIFSPNLPPGAALLGDRFVWAPTSTQIGTHSVTFITQDGDDGVGSTTITITVKDPTDNLRAYWRFNEQIGTQAADASGYGRVAALVNGPNWTGQSILTDGENDYINAGTTTFDLSGELTISMWINPIGTLQNQQTLIQRGIDSYPFTITLNDNTIQTCIRTVNGTDWLNANLQVQPDQWYHIVMTYKSGERIIYVNGLQDIVDSTSPSGNMEIISDLTTTIASNGNGGGYFRGYIDNIRIYNRALTATECREVYYFQEVEENQLAQVVLLPCDLSGNPVVFSPVVIGLPKGASFDPVTNTLSWQPWYDQSGIYEMVFHAVGSDYTQKVTIEVTDVILKTWNQSWIDDSSVQSAMVEY